ncbi:MAG: hypothetical protein K6F87_08435 [Lachnospiraceae bacterium]|nr:hypothetical protein [Lachnospiraceae bacterium]
MNKKTFITLLACIVCMMIFAGCNSAKESAAPAPDDTKAEQETEEVKPDDNEDNKAEETQEDIWEEVVGEDERSVSREELFMQVLYKYKEAQDGRFSDEEVEKLGIWTELVQHAWPFGSNNDEVRYLYYDVDSDGNDELIITYYNDIIDIYGYDGDKVRHAYSTPYRGIAQLYPDGMLRSDLSISAADYTTTWLQYDTDLGDYFSVFEKYHDGGVDSFYTFCYYKITDEERAEVMDSYRDHGGYPVWIHEWSDKITEQEYEKIEPKTMPIRLSEGELISKIEFPADYVFMTRSEAADEDAAYDFSSDDYGEEIELTKDMQKKLNVFVSNFAEQGMESFDYGHPDLEKVTRFAYMWSKINKQSNIKVEGNYYCISFDLIKKIAEKYFALTVTEDELNGISWDEENYGAFRNGKFYAPLADGETYTTLAIVSGANDFGSDTMRVEFSVYDLDLDIYFESTEGISKKYYSMSASEAVKSSDLTKVGSGYAIVRKDGDSYKLMYYSAKRF